MSRNFQPPAYQGSPKVGIGSPGAIPAPPDPMGGMASAPKVAPRDMPPVMPSSAPKMAPPLMQGPGPMPLTPGAAPAPPMQASAVPRAPAAPGFGFSRPTPGYSPAKV